MGNENWPVAVDTQQLTQQGVLGGYRADIFFHSDVKNGINIEKTNQQEAFRFKNKIMN